MISQPPFDQGTFGIHTEAAWSHPEKTVRVMFFRLIAQKATDDQKDHFGEVFVVALRVR